MDLKTEEGLDVVIQLLGTADVLIENFAPGTIKRLGLGHERICELYPRLIYCSLKGFLPGPYENRHAMDEVVQMMSGLAYMTGPRGRPLRAGSSVVDIAGGMFGVIGILSAIIERQSTGQGRYVQSALFETAAFLMGQHMAYGAITKKPVPPMPERVSAWSIYQTFETQDGRLVFIGIISDKHWLRFCEAFGRSDLGQNGDYSTNNQRLALRHRLIPDIAEMIRKHSIEDVVMRCERATIPCSTVATPEDLWQDEHLLSSGGLTETHLPNGETCLLPKLPLAIQGVDLETRIQPAAIGAESFEILESIGMAKSRIDAMAAAGVVAIQNDLNKLKLI